MRCEVAVIGWAVLGKCAVEAQILTMFFGRCGNSVVWAGPIGRRLASIVGKGGSASSQPDGMVTLSKVAPVESMAFTVALALLRLTSR
jgi:hypothetical protein